MRVAKEFFLTLNETTSQTQEKHFAVTVVVLKFIAMRYRLIAYVTFY